MHLVVTPVKTGCPGTAFRGLPQAATVWAYLAGPGILLCRGGWPDSLDLQLKADLRARRDYLEEIQRLDIRRVDGVAVIPIGALGP